MAKSRKRSPATPAPVKGLAFSPDGTKLYSASADKTLRGWNLADGKQLWQVESPAAMRDLTINKDGTLLVSADEDNKLRVWSSTPEAKKDKDGKPEPIQPVRELAGHGKPVTAVALILPAGTQVLSGSEDGTVRVWDINNGRQVRTMNHGGSVTDVAASPDGKAFASTSTANTAKLWNAANGQQIAEVKGGIEQQRNLNAVTEDKTVADQLVKLADAAEKAADKNLKDREAAVKTAEEAKKKADEAVKDPQKKVDEAKAKLKAGPGRVGEEDRRQRPAEEGRGRPKGSHQAGSGIEESHRCPGRRPTVFGAFAKSRSNGPRRNWKNPRRSTKRPRSIRKPWPQRSKKPPTRTTPRRSLSKASRFPPTAGCSRPRATIRSCNSGPP